MALFKGVLTSSLLVAVILAGCASVPMVSQPVYEGPGVLVRLDRPQGQGPALHSDNSHPATFTDETLSLILRSVMVQRDISIVSYYVLRQDPKAERALSDDDIRLLAPALSAALAKAQPEDTVVFIVNRPRAEGVGEVTSGGLFVRGEQLSLLLANLRVPVTAERKIKRAREQPLTPLTEPDFTIVLGAHQTLFGRKDPGFPRWSGAARGLAIAFPAVLARQDSKGSSDTLSPPKAEERAGPEPQTGLPTSLDHKLRQLKTWMEQGLITEREYQEQKRRLLETQ